MGVTNFDTLATRVVDVSAAAGGGKPNATLLLAGSNASGGQAGAFRVITVATATDSVRLPSASNGGGNGQPQVGVGTEIVVVNEGANAMQVFGSDTDTINGAATGTGVSQAAGTYATYKLMGLNAGAGDWRRNLSA